MYNLLISLIVLLAILVVLSLKKATTTKNETEEPERICAHTGDW